MTGSRPVGETLAAVLTPSLLFFHQVGVRVPLDHFVLPLLLGYPLIVLAPSPARWGFALLQRAASPDRETSSSPTTVDPSDGSPAADEAAEIADHLHVQALLRRFLAVLGGMLTLAILGVGALFQAYNAYNGEHRPELDSTPQQFLVLGGIWAGVVAALYLPAHEALERRAEAIRDRLSPLPSVSDPSFAAGTDRRNRLSGIVGFGGPLRSKLESGILILSPLVGAVFTSFVGG